MAYQICVPDERPYLPQLCCIAGCQHRSDRVLSRHHRFVHQEEERVPIRILDLSLLKLNFILNSNLLGIYRQLRTSGDRAL